MTGDGFADRLARWLDRLAPAVVVLAVLTAFVPALGAQFVDWDDDLNVTENPRFRGLSPAHLRWMFTTVHGGHYQPLSWVSLALDHRAWGMDPFGYSSPGRTAARSVRGWATSRGRSTT